MSDSGAYALLVEDDPDVGALLRHHLGSVAYDVVHVPTAEQALERIAACSPTIAVVDIVLPGLDGRAVVRALQSSPEHRGCRIIVASIIDRDDLGVDVDAVLSKPFRRTDFVDALHQAGAQPWGGRP